MPGEPAVTVHCRRCGEEALALPRPPLRGPIGESILASTCVRCWEEWQKAEVMVINELRLNFMDPKSQQVLLGHMSEFLFLPTDV